MIYLDYAATTPMCEEALDAFHEASKKYYGNTNSLHDIGSKSEQVLEMCRTELAGIVNGKKEGIYFTSGGSEASILGIRSLLGAHKHQGKHIITTEAEHSSVYNLFLQLEKEGFTVTFLSLDNYGRIRIDDLKEAITPETILVSIQHANSEIGTIQPVKDIGRLLHSYGVIFHSDCVQTFGKIPIDVEGCYIDSLSVSSHKVYGPKGVGACYINPAIAWKMQSPGTTHENGFRPGTINVPGIVAFTSAAQLSVDEMDENQKKFQLLRERLISGILEFGHRIQVVENQATDHLPQIVGLTVEGTQGHYIMLECNRHGIAISTGSACQAGSQKPSRAMLAMGKSNDEAKQLIRLSFGKDTSVQDIDAVVGALKSIMEQIKNYA